MTTLAWIILVFSLFQFCIALINAIFRQSLSNSARELNPFVSILIPARNEEENIANLLHDLQNQNWQNFEILVFNDQSTDKTAEIVQGFKKNNPRIQLINSGELPENWLGKNYGCHTLAQNAKGEYYLFLDADVRISGSVIYNAVASMKRQKLGLLSVFPKQIMLSVGEYIAVPNMNFILLTLLPLVLVKTAPFPSLAAANGQFMLFNAEIYHHTKPHYRFRRNKVEDIEIARYLKKQKLKIACLAGNYGVSCHMYKSFSEALNGFAKNVIMFFGNSWLLAILFWLLTSLGFIPVILTFSGKVLYGFFAVVTATRILVSAVSRQNILKNLVLAIPQQLVLGLFILKALRNKSKNAFEWKGRTIS